MMGFINGVCLNDLFTDPNEAEHTRLLREDISDGDVEVIYRQPANFLLQLFSLDFDTIGSLPSLEAKFESPMPKRPLTYKVYDILRNGGVDVFGDRCQGFTTATKYFQYLLGQDFKQNDHRSFPFAQLRQHVGEKKWERHKAEFRTLPEGEAFVTQKTLGLKGI
ncbi:hypothetical protein QQZ08_003774 [Neonectria magnoliae]|uniref:Uncharacterized protein n=1 Tax=Neonectria magnoliae TaxID=2732573 RepID=A0ABR1I824_9HYPO